MTWDKIFPDSILNDYLSFNTTLIMKKSHYHISSLITNLHGGRCAYVFTSKQTNDFSLSEILKYSVVTNEELKYFIVIQIKL